MPPARAPFSARQLGACTAVSGCSGTGPPQRSRSPRRPPLSQRGYPGRFPGVSDVSGRRSQWTALDCTPWVRQQNSGQLATFADRGITKHRGPGYPERDPASCQDLCAANPVSAVRSTSWRGLTPAPPDWIPAKRDAPLQGMRGRAEESYERCIEQTDARTLTKTGVLVNN